MQSKSGLSSENLPRRIKNGSVLRFCPCCYVTDIRTDMASNQVYEVLYFLYGTPEMKEKEWNKQMKREEWIEENIMDCR